MTKLQDLTESTSIAGSDLVYVLSDPAGAKLDKKVKVSNLPISTPAATALALKANTADLPEAIDDRIAALLVAGANITLSYDDAGNALTISSTASGGGSTNDAQNLNIWSDFLSSTALHPFISDVANGGTILKSSSSDSPYGAISMYTASNAAAVVAIRTELDAFILGSGAYSYTSRIRTWVLSNGTDTYAIRSGFMDVVNADAVDGVYFRLIGANWFAVTRSNSTETAVDTGITAVTQTWYKFDININATGTQAIFKINGSTVATITTNIPTGSLRRTGLVSSIVKTLGTGACWFDIDYKGMTSQLTVSR